MIRKISFSLILTVLLLTPSPTLAASGGLLDTIKNALAPIVDILDDYAAIATGDNYASVWSMGGADWKSTETTDQALQGQLTAPAEYYAEAPAELRDAGYTLEQIRNKNPDSMAARDFASWLGGFIAVPFLYVRGFKQIGGLFGPLGLLIDWV
ncbi:MAG: hypothetical protein DRI81_20355, partial [Chloroflexi bacterium]